MYSQLIVFETCTILCVSLLLVTLSLCNNSKSTNISDINILLLTNGNHKLYGRNLLTPAIDIAIDKISRDQLLHNRKFVIHFNNTHCDSTHGPVAAIKFWHRGGHAIFGPVCEYSLVPVARYAPFWNIPIISAGGLAHDFRLKQSNGFTTLTLTHGVQFTTTAYSVMSTMEAFNWESFTILYDSKGQNEVSNKYCYIATEAMVTIFKQSYKYKVKSVLINSDRPSRYENVLKDSIGLKNAGK